MVDGLLALRTAVPIIDQFAVALQKVLEVSKQASRNEIAKDRLMELISNIEVNQAVDSSTCSDQV